MGGQEDSRGPSPSWIGERDLEVSGYLRGGRRLVGGLDGMSWKVGGGNQKWFRKGGGAPIRSLGSPAGSPVNLQLGWV